METLFCCCWSQQNYNFFYRNNYIPSYKIDLHCLNKRRTKKRRNIHIHVEHVFAIHKTNVMKNVLSFIQLVVYIFSFDPWWFLTNPNLQASTIAIENVCNNVSKTSKIHWTNQSIWQSKYLIHWGNCQSLKSSIVHSSKIVLETINIARHLSHWKIRRIFSRFQFLAFH